MHLCTSTQKLEHSSTQYRAQYSAESLTGMTLESLNPQGPCTTMALDTSQAMVRAVAQLRSTRPTRKQRARQLGGGSSRGGGVRGGGGAGGTS